MHGRLVASLWHGVARHGTATQQARERDQTALQRDVVIGGF